MADHETKRSQMIVGGKIAGIIPQNFDDCFRVARLLASSGMVPDAFKDKPEAACVAIMQGLEIGLAPMAALQSIAVINGRPSIWGDGALALVKNSGLCEWIKEWTEGDTAYCETKRKGEKETVKRSFSDADAKAAGLIGKSGPWQSYRARMRQMRARSFTIRDCYPDVLKGLSIAEEAQDIPMKDITPTAPRAIEAQPASDRISQEQLATLNAAIEVTNRNRARLMKHLKVTDLTELPAADFNRALSAVKGSSE